MRNVRVSLLLRLEISAELHFHRITQVPKRKWQRLWERYVFEETIHSWLYIICYSNYFLRLSIIRIITLPLYIAMYTIFLGKPKIKGWGNLNENFGTSGILAEPSNFFLSASVSCQREAICGHQWNFTRLWRVTSSGFTLGEQNPKQTQYSRADSNINSLPTAPISPQWLGVCIPTALPVYRDP